MNDDSPKIGHLASKEIVQMMSTDNSAHFINVEIAEVIGISPDGSTEHIYVHVTEFEDMLACNVDYPSPQESEMRYAMHCYLNLSQRKIPKRDRNEEARRLIMQPTTQFYECHGATLAQLANPVVEHRAYVVLEIHTWKGMPFKPKSGPGEPRRQEWTELHARAERILPEQTDYAIWARSDRDDNFWIAVPNESFLHHVRLAFA
jgi:hypothetical protein